MSTATYIGIVDGLHTWELLDEDGNRIGTNQSPYLPGEEPVPESVTARQIRLYLVQAGVGLSAVEQAIDAIPDPLTRDTVRVEWEYAPYVERSHPWIIPLAAALGMSESQVDDAFREAARI